MEHFEGRIAVVTGGGSGIGRALVRQLAAAGAHVSMCDLSAENLAASAAAAREGAPDGTRITTSVADVSDEQQVMAFRDHVVAEHGTDHVHLVVNNAGVSGGGSFLLSSRDDWDRCFGVCWSGVYHGCRAFAPLLVAADEGHLVNISSVNGFWASMGPQTPHTAYSAAKFAVRGFTEALITDFRLNAPHVGVSVVMPGHIGTDIVINSMQAMLEGDGGDLRRMVERQGIDTSALGDDELKRIIRQRGEMFREQAPTTAEQAAAVILDGVRARRWRILVGDDARYLDEQVRQDPEAVYEPTFLGGAGPVTPRP